METGILVGLAVGLAVSLVLGVLNLILLVLLGNGMVRIMDAVSDDDDDDESEEATRTDRKELPWYEYPVS